MAPHAMVQMQHLPTPLCSRPRLRSAKAHFLEGWCRQWEAQTRDPSSGEGLALERVPAFHGGLVEETAQRRGGGGGGDGDYLHVGGGGGGGGGGMARKATQKTGVGMTIGTHHGEGNDCNCHTTHANCKDTPFQVSYKTIILLIYYRNQ